ncbi:MAG: hypothetical protein LUP97_03430 [Methanoregula sp.]|nr:hypothetical protein [Methanoregula sp.]
MTAQQIGSAIGVNGASLVITAAAGSRHDLRLHRYPRARYIPPHSGILLHVAIIPAAYRVYRWFLQGDPVIPGPKGLEIVHE